MGIRRGGVIVSKDPSPRLQHSQEEVHLARGGESPSASWSLEARDCFTENSMETGASRV